MSGAAVLFGSALVADDGGAWKLLPPGWGWAELVEAAAALEVDAVLYLRGEGEAGLEAAPPAAPAGLDVAVTGSQPAPWRWRVAGLEVVDVAADVSRLAGPFDALDARELVDALAALRKLLGVSWAAGIGRTAERLILSTHPRARGGVLLDRGVSMPEPVTDGSLETAWTAWRRELTADERRRGWLHVFDQNAQYLAAWITAELGHGQPVHVKGPRFDSRTVGVWRVPDLATVPLAGYDTALLPRPHLDRGEWFTTATLAAVWELAHPHDLPEIVEAWHWPRRSRFLRGAGERLRDARASAELAIGLARTGIRSAVDEDEAARFVRRRVTADVALAAVKALYRVQTGRFAMARANSDGHPWYRPDWAHTVRATARVNLHRRLCKLSAQPFAIATDALAFLSDEPDPAAFAARAGLPVGGRLGEFHHAGTVSAAVVGELVDLADARTGRIMRAVGEAAELEGVS